MAGEMNAADRSHPLYDDNIGKWDLYRNAAKGGGDFINESNLFTHRLEDAEDYTQRLDRAYYLNFCDSIPNMYNSYIFRNNIERPVDTNLELFRKNCDGKGTSISDFVKLAGYYGSIYGVMHIFVDMPESKKKNPSVADVKNEGILPYCSLLHPTQLKDFSVDEFGNFRWVIIEYKYYKDLDPAIERVEETHYKVITTEKWWIEDQDGNKVTFEEKERKSEGVNKLKFIPIITLYNKDNGEDNKIGESLLKDIVRINRIIMNWCSCIDEQVERQTFSQLIMPDDADMDEDEERGADPLDRVGTSSIFTFNPDSRHPPAFISPNTDNINTIWSLVEDHIKEIFRLSGLQGGTADLYTSKSGKQSQTEFKGVNAALVEKAMTYQKCENSISKLAYVLLGQDDTNYEDVKYPKTFDVVELGEEIDNLFRILERNFSSTLNKTIMKDVARKSIPLAPESIRTTAESEIDSGDGVVTSLDQSKTPVPVKDGEGNPNTNLSQSFITNKQMKDTKSQHRTQE